MVEKQYLHGMRPWHYLYFLKNPFDYTIRNKVRWNRPIIDKNSTLITSIISEYNEPVKLSANRLVKAYHLDKIDFPFHRALGEVNLYYLNLFISAFQEIEDSFPEKIVAADIGPSDWFYLPALVSFLTYYQYEDGRSIRLEGYEIDPYRVYNTFHARHNIAAQRVAAFDGVEYFKTPFKPIGQTYDLILQCFPFLFLKDHLSWGLPGNLFDPQKLLMDVAFSLKEKGLLLIINQGVEENQLQKTLLEKADLKILKEFKFVSDFKQYDHEHYVMVAGK